MWLLAALALAARADERNAVVGDAARLEERLAEARSQKDARPPNPMQEIGGPRAASITCRAEPASACGAAWAAADDEERRTFGSADRLVREALRIRDDPDCMTATLDAATTPNFHLEAVNLFRKCQLVVLRNVTDPAYVRDYGRHLAAHIATLRETGPEGLSTRNEEYQLKGIGDGRWLMLLPEAFATPEFIAPHWIRRILSHPRLLGEYFKLNDLGAALSEPRSEAQYFHVDDDFIYGMKGLAIHGVGGHDLPPSAITVLHPISPEELTEEHGPTEFCMGSSALGGFEFPKAGNNVLDPNLLEQLLRTYAVNGRKRPACAAGPGGALRRDTLRAGDAVLFNYQLVHRGGENRSPDVRALLYSTYARHWFTDGNFQSPYRPAEKSFVNGAGWSALSNNAKNDYARFVKEARFAALPGGHDAGHFAEALDDDAGFAALTSRPLFPRDPSDAVTSRDEEEYGLDTDYDHGERMYEEPIAEPVYLNPPKPQDYLGAGDAEL